MNGSESLPCPACASTQSRVVDSRMTERGKRRRRICHKCEFRFSTIEQIDSGETNQQELNGMLMRDIKRLDIRLEALEKAHGIFPTDKDAGSGEPPRAPRARAGALEQGGPGSS